MDNSKLKRTFKLTLKDINILNKEIQKKLIKLLFKKDKS